jgi:hypothetical protein
MSVWICIPSIRPGGGTLPEWKARGYKVAVLRQGDPFPEADITIRTDKYLGWAESVNLTVKTVMILDKEAEWFVAGGDDTLPDPDHTPEQIAAECRAHFYGRLFPTAIIPDPGFATFGVMQPTGDLKHWNSAIDKFAGSPWMGREWCRRAFGGRGPIWPEFHHMFGDEHLQRCAEKLGVFWQRPDLTHKHMHALRPGSHATRVGDPALFGRKHWDESTALFRRLEAGGFKEAEELAA